MKIAIVGAGAIGGMITALLARIGADPLLIARGPTLAAIRQHGLTFE
ncbi:MAG TPA: oxidoreductase, partial [Rhodospirillaceae bacterium]|nr:oxidoreductase [Rhodospirillaceae bacterium]